MAAPSQVDMMDLPLEGDITVPGAPPESEDQLSTLDEPIRETVVSSLAFLHILAMISIFLNT